ncbi:DNA repair RAD52-like protein 2, chloroplastic isoform X2 [Macadamia integrifolia]|uniref:DNA repair RAD52-like protein 2, chloroplastic isoform X2 n=1 Tax=Macadamia integrifolia TaxID=60698 RepID=UPI001C4FCC43|nr:DNA repair RAD52-like protein 2, chloroplastic isoform X2 [Macadamia integrifolia]
MALHNAIFLNKSVFPAISSPPCSSCTSDKLGISRRRSSRRSSLSLVVWALEKNSGGSGSGSSSSNAAKKTAVPNSNYVVPLDKSSCIMRPLAEILRDLNKRVPDKIIKPDTNYIPWYHANRMLSFYAPGWCGEIRDVIFADNGGVTVVYRVTIHGSDGEAHRESTGTVSLSDGSIEDPVAAAEEISFCRACARFGLGLYLYHEDEML